MSLWAYFMKKEIMKSIEIRKDITEYQQERLQRLCPEGWEAVGHSIEKSSKYGVYRHQVCGSLKALQYGNLYQNQTPTCRTCLEESRENLSENWIYLGPSERKNYGIYRHLCGAIKHINYFHLKEIGHSICKVCC